MYDSGLRHSLGIALGETWRGDLLWRSGGNMIYRFADCALDTQLHILHRGWREYTTGSQGLPRCSCYLIEHRDRVVSKQELCDRVWEGLAISDATLESCLRAVGSTVGDSGQALRTYQTQRGYGYRFVADVTEERSRSARYPSRVPRKTPAAPQPVEPQPPAPWPLVRLGVTCQHANDEAAIFCAACGTRLRQLCVHCGQNVTLPAMFCTTCGQPLVAPMPPSPVPTPPGQAEA